MQYIYSQKVWLCNPLYDLKMLEQNGVYLEKLGRQTVRGTVLFVAADNLGAHSLAGFLKSFSVERFCRFCKWMYKCKHRQWWCSAARGMFWSLSGACQLNENVDHFHVVTGYPPEIMHDVFEGVVSIELSLCLTDLLGDLKVHSTCVKSCHQVL